jgi:hypothetical protein
MLDRASGRERLEALILRRLSEVTGRPVGELLFERIAAAAAE